MREQTAHKLIQTCRYHGVSKQHLKRVQLYAPTIIWITQGKKRLWWQDKDVIFNAQNWLIVPSSQHITFTNEPDKGGFFARSLSFYLPPPIEWISSSANKSLNIKPTLSVTTSLAYCFDILFEMDEKQLSHETQKQLLLAFYHELKQAGALHLLFPRDINKLSEKLAHYLSFNPGEQYKLNEVASHFLMSRATFIRKLAAEGTSFRHVLTNVRMLYSVTLMQKSNCLLFVSLSCGYQSPTRFSDRFKQTFGLTPKNYLKTLGNKNVLFD